MPSSAPPEGWQQATSQRASESSAESIRPPELLALQHATLPISSVANAAVAALAVNVCFGSKADARTGSDGEDLIGAKPGSRRSCDSPTFISGRSSVRARALVVLVSVPAALVLASPATAKGCIRGAIVGGVAGHYAHHHAVAGAVAGCAAGHIYYKHKAHQVARHR